LGLIAKAARQLSNVEEPPARVWVNIANQLRAEGIIREPQQVPARVAPAPRRWNAWWLVPIAAAIIAAGAYEIGHKARQVAQQPAQTIQQSSTAVATSAVAPKVDATQQGTLQASDRSSVHSDSGAGSQTLPAETSTPPAEQDQQFLSEASEGAPAMRTTYEKQLQAVNEEILETQEYIKTHPGDVDARQHLMETYQQKAMLYQMALDRIQ
jgi:ribosomal protein S15P/S13E